MARSTKPNANPALAIGYVRVSTDRQDLGPEAQREALERWCAAQGCELLAVYEDRGVSGAAPLDKREGLVEALGALTEQGAGTLLVAKHDRLARDVVVGAMIERLVQRVGARIVSADGVGNGNTPEAAMMRSLVAVFAQYERQLIAQRTRLALAAKKRRGEFCGGHVPYGFRIGADGRTLEPDPLELEAIRLARELRASGRSLRAICLELALAGFRPKASGKWHPKVVADLLAGEAA